MSGIFHWFLENLSKTKESFERPGDPDAGDPDLETLAAKRRWQLSRLGVAAAAFAADGQHSSLEGDAVRRVRLDGSARRCNGWRRDGPHLCNGATWGHRTPRGHGGESSSSEAAPEVPDVRDVTDLGRVEGEQRGRALPPAAQLLLPQATGGVGGGGGQGEAGTD